jgi:IS1 family transposase
VQFDEKWSFVAKKQDRCDPDADPADAWRGENWDHVALDPEHRLIVAVVPGKRTAENCRELVAEFHRRTTGRVMRLMTSDEYPSYKVAIQQVYGLRSVPLRVLPQPRGRPRVPKRRVPPELNYAMVHKHRRDGRVVKVSLETVFGSDGSVAAALEQSTVSNVVNTSFVERHNGTDRHRNARKGRGTYRFSKDWQVHEAMTYFTMYSYNFCWPVRTLATTDEAGRRRPCTPAMAAGLNDHVWSLREWLTLPAATQRS